MRSRSLSTGIATPAISSGSAEREALYLKYADKLSVNPSLTRQLVSFQANKKTPFYRWLKYKEAFSSELVRYLLKLVKSPDHSDFRVLDPFAGVGTTLTTAAAMGRRATGIELLPVGVAAIRARLNGHRVDREAFERCLNRVKSIRFEEPAPGSYSFPHLRITRNAFPEETELAVSAYMDFLNSIEDEDIRYLLWFACLSILEDISYTRKDGQYLRWDSRCARSLKSNFNKGRIHDFKSAIVGKLEMMLEDIKYATDAMLDDRVQVKEGSCLDELPKFPLNSFNAIITSPPYANRYDYTRTYALEIAFMDYDEEAVKRLRQALLSCTVENRSKRNQLAHDYAARNRKDAYQTATQVFENQESVHEVLGILRKAGEQRALNNSNIPNLLENYLFEMNLMVHEFARVLKPGGTVFMVNDNVRYHGEEIPIDLILSDFAAEAGLGVDHIWFLPKGKGNSSQQMGAHGRTELRKCIYCWSKPVSA